MNVLIVAPHADDEVLGCGGVMSRYIREGAKVYVVVVTNGSIGAPELYSTDRVESMRAQAMRSHSYLGVSETFFLDFPAPRLDTFPSYQISAALLKILTERLIDTVFIPHRGDMHKDHAVVYHATLVAARPINNCPVKTIYAYETLSETEWAPPFGDDAFIPNVFFDISEDLAKKVKAMQFYTTQIKESPHPRSIEIIESLARLRGSTIGCRFAEAFMLVRLIK